MDLKNKKFKMVDDIINYQIDDPVTSKVGNFYETDPFPNYEINDDVNKILKVGDGNFFLKSLKNFIGHKKNTTGNIGDCIQPHNHEKKIEEVPINASVEDKVP